MFHSSKSVLITMFTETAHIHPIRDEDSKSYLQTGKIRWERRWESCFLHWRHCDLKEGFAYRIGDHRHIRSFHSAVTVSRCLMHCRMHFLLYCSSFIINIFRCFCVTVFLIYPQKYRCQKSKHCFLCRIRIFLFTCVRGISTHRTQFYSLNTFSHICSHGISACLVYLYADKHYPHKSIK